MNDPMSERSQQAEVLRSYGAEPPALDDHSAWKAITDRFPCGLDAETNWTVEAAESLRRTVRLAISGAYT